MKECYVFDMDGTITSAQFSKVKGKICETATDDNSLLLRNFRHNFYTSGNPVPFVKDTIELRLSENKPTYVLTQIHDGLELFHKEDLLNKIFKNHIARNYLIGTISLDQKIAILREMSTIYDKVVYIEDSLENLIYMEKILMSESGTTIEHYIPKIELVHISTYITEQYDLYMKLVY